MPLIILLTAQSIPAHNMDGSFMAICIGYGLYELSVSSMQFLGFRIYDNDAQDILCQSWTHLALKGSPGDVAPALKIVKVEDNVFLVCPAACRSTQVAQDQQEAPACLEAQA